MVLHTQKEGPIRNIHPSVGDEEVGGVVLTPSRARAEGDAPRSRASPGACGCGMIYIQVHELTEGAGEAEASAGPRWWSRRKASVVVGEGGETGR